MAFAITKTWTPEILTASDLNGAFTELETELNAFPTDGALASLSVGTAQLKSNAVTLAKMADDSVDEDEIVDGAVTAGKVGTGAITNTKLGAASVTAAKISTVLGTPTRNDSDSNTIAANSTYRASSDGFLLAYFAVAGAYTVTCYSDTNSTPTTVVWRGQTSVLSSMSVPINNGYYVKVEAAYESSTTQTILRWFPIGATGELIKQ